MGQSPFEFWPKDYFAFPKYFGLGVVVLFQWNLGLGEIFGLASKFSLEVTFNMGDQFPLTENTKNFTQLAK
jgi:hypothetical protein